MVLLVSNNDLIGEGVAEILYNNKVEYKWVDKLEDGNFSLIISAHAKEIFPKSVVESCRCINIHPGLNPFNRGMFPHVFSIINGLPAGATIHEMDEYIDSGKIIVQSEVAIKDDDTSDTLYERIIEKEIELFDRYFDLIIHGKRGNLNTMKDYRDLCKLDLGSIGTLGQHINLLRALTHGDHKNAYFVDKDGEKVFVQIKLTR